MEELAFSVLAYALWPLLSLAMIGLWVAAAVDIVRHRHDEVFTHATLLCMVGLVTVVAVLAITSIGAVFGSKWSEAVTSANHYGVRTGEQQEDVPARAYLFSFGLEHVSHAMPAEPTSANQRR